VEVVSPGAPQSPAAPGAGVGRLTVEARSSGATTQITLTNAGGAPMRWSVRTEAGWLRFSSTSGTLAPGGTITLQVYVNHRREPRGDWSARIGVDPSGAVVSVTGHGRRHHHPPTDDPKPPATQDPDPTPPEPTPTPTDPAPTPTPTPSDTATPPPPSETATPEQT
jgi:hypothetical protein